MRTRTEAAKEHPVSNQQMERTLTSPPQWFHKQYHSPFTRMWGLDIKYAIHHDDFFRQVRMASLVEQCCFSNLNIRPAVQVQYLVDVLQGGKERRIMIKMTIYVCNCPKKKIPCPMVEPLVYHQRDNIQLAQVQGTTGYTHLSLFSSFSITVFYPRHINYQESP